MEFYIFVVLRLEFFQVENIFYCDIIMIVLCIEKDIYFVVKYICV